jgi:hypothetical protein
MAIIGFVDVIVAKAAITEMIVIISKTIFK